MKSTAWAGVLILVWCSQALGQAGGQDTLHLTDAVAAALSRHPALDLQRQDVEIDAAVQRQASGTFDSVVETSLDHGRVYTPSTQITGIAFVPHEASNVAASYSRLLRSGLTLAGSIDLRRQVDTATLPDGLTTSSSRLQLIFPLMRGRGTRITTAEEVAAGLRRDSSVLELRHVTAALITHVVTSYWQLVAAERNRVVASGSAERGARLVENTRALIEADQIPRSDLASARANAADREAARLEAEQAFVEARQQLLLDMGYRDTDRAEISSLDDFTILEQLPDARTLPDDPASFIEGTLARRADYAAAQARIESARLLREAATNGLLPQVDLSANVGYSSFAEGRTFGRFWSASGSEVDGLDAFAQITYRLPMQNRLASGRLAQADAELRRATLTRDDLARTIRSSVIASYSALRNALTALRRTRESVEAFQEALAGEQDKLALGIGSIVNLLTIEDRLTAAAARDVAAWRSYGQALIDFRFATGTLVPARNDLTPPSLATFTTFPFAPDAHR